MKRLFFVIMTNILWGLLAHSEPAHWLFRDVFCCDNLSHKLKKNGFLQETSYDLLIPSNPVQFRNSSIFPCNCCLLQYLLPYLQPPCPTNLSPHHHLNSSHSSWLGKASSSWSHLKWNHSDPDGLAGTYSSLTAALPLLGEKRGDSSKLNRNLSPLAFHKKLKEHKSVVISTEPSHTAGIIQSAPKFSGKWGEKIKKQKYYDFKSPFSLESKVKKIYNCVLSDGVSK